MCEDDEYGYFHDCENRAGAVEDTNEFTAASKQKLTEHNVLTRKFTLYIKEKGLKLENIQIIKHGKTLRPVGEKHLQKMELDYIAHCMEKMFKSEPGKKEHMTKLLTEDPVGATTPSKDDEFCWTRNTVFTPSSAAAPAPATTRVTRSGATATATAAAAAAATAPAPAPASDCREHRVPTDEIPDQP